MKLLAILAVLSIAGTCKADWENLYLKFTMLLDGYFPIALTQEELLKDDWEYMVTDSDLNVDFYSYGDDPRVSIGFDTYGNIAGVRVSYIIEDLTNQADGKDLSFNYTYSNKPIFSTATYWDTEVYYTTVLFASPEKLKAGGRSETNGLLADNIYVKINGKYKVMPKEESKATNMGFVKQGCFPGMGQHYFLDMHNTTECNNLQGVFLLYENEELIGMGLTPFGSFTNSYRNWFESPPTAAIEIIVPNRPACLTQWVSDYGSTSLHFFFKKHPRVTLCL